MPRSIVPRHARPLVLDALKDNRIACVVGARQVGKSTLARDIAERDHPASVQTLDDAATRASARRDPTGFVWTLSRPALIDEVQRAPDLMLAIKQLVDEEPSRGQFLLTGSANVMTLPAIADALPGRVEYVTLWPFSQGELAGRREAFLDAAFHGRPPMIQGAPVGRGAYAARIAAGGFPDVHDRSARGRASFFNSYVSSLLGRQLDELATVRDPDSLPRLLRLLAARTGELVDHAGVARDLGVSDKTVKSYVGVLESLFLIHRIEPWFGNLNQRLIKTPKLYVTDTGLLAYLLRANQESIVADGSLAGRFVEAFAVGEIVRQASWLHELVHVYHYRDRVQREIDLVLERHDRSLCGVEIKSGATVNARHFRALGYLRDQMGDRFRCGVVLYTGTATLPFGDRLWAVPLEALWA